MTLNQNYLLLQTIEKILDNSFLCDDDEYCTDESLVFCFSGEQKKELEKIKKTLVSKCKSLL